MTINDKVQTLDLKHLTQDEINWLHELKNKAQKIRNAEYCKANGITQEMLKGGNS